MSKSKLKDWLDSEDFRHCEKSARSPREYESDREYYDKTDQAAFFVAGMIVRENQASKKVIYRLIEWLLTTDLPLDLASSLRNSIDEKLSRKQLNIASRNARILKTTYKRSSKKYVADVAYHTLRMRVRGGFTLNGYVAMENLRKYLKTCGELEPGVLLMAKIRELISFEEWEAGL